MKKNHSGKVKGFTIIELLIVIAILAILASMISLFISGFVRDSRMETSNNKAKQLFGTVQNFITELEIEDDQNTLNSSYYSTSGSATKTTYATITYSIDAGQITADGFTIDTFETPSTTGSFTLKSSDTDVKLAAGYKKMEKYLTDNIASDFTGTCVAYVNFEDYSVDSVCYYDQVNSKDLLQKLSDFSFTGYTNKFKGIQNVSEEKNFMKMNSGAIIGCYPLLDDVGGYAKV